ncbi:MAG: ATP-binding protein [Polyangiaceae bacterium]
MSEFDYFEHGLQEDSGYGPDMPPEGLVQLRTRKQQTKTASGNDGPTSRRGSVTASSRESPLGAAARSVAWPSIWWRTAAPGTLFLLAYFAAYEVFERLVLDDAPHSTLHLLHIVRGTGAAILLATWAFYSVNKLRARVEHALANHVRLLESHVKARTHELEDAQNFTELLFDSLRERIMVVDQAGVVVKANRVALTNAGRELVGQRCIDVFRACQSHGGCAATCAFHTSREGSIETKIRPDNQGRLWEVETIPVQDKTGTVRLMLEVGRDITQQKSLEAQLLHQEKMAGLGVLTAGFAHDLGNPLASLSSELELLEDEQDVKRLRASLSVLREHVARINRTLREMVDFARRRRDELAEVSMASVIHDATRLVCHDRRWKRVDLLIEIPVALPMVRIVEDHLLLVLINLMLNAADAMPDGGQLSIRGSTKGKNVVLSVRDTGVGMSADVLRQATKPLFTTKDKNSGTGLGLSVSNDVISAAGGTLTLDSVLGEGTEVTITLPAVELGDIHRSGSKLGSATKSEAVDG